MGHSADDACFSVSLSHAADSADIFQPGADRHHGFQRKHGVTMISLLRCHETDVRSRVGHQPSLTGRLATVATGPSSALTNASADTVADVVSCSVSVIITSHYRPEEQPKARGPRAHFLRRQY